MTYSARLKAIAARWLPSPEYLLENVVCHVPLVGPRMALFALFGVRFGNRKTCSIMLATKVSAPSRLQLGQRVVIGPECLIDARGGIVIGDDVNISGRSVLQTAKHLVDDPHFRDQNDPIVVEDRVWVGTGSMIFGGVTLSHGCVVAAGSVVTKDVPPFTVVGGVPARPLRGRPRDLVYELSYRPNWR